MLMIKFSADDEPMETEPAPKVDPQEEKKKREEEQKRKEEQKRYDALPENKKQVLS